MSRNYYHPNEHEISLARVLFALSDPIRLNIVRALAKHQRLNSSDLVHNMPKSTITHHTRILRESGVTNTNTEGRYCWISLRYDILNKKFPGLLSSILQVQDDEDA